MYTVKEVCTIHVHANSRFLDTKANDRVLLFLVDKSFQHTEGLGDGTLKQLKKIKLIYSNMCDYQYHVHNHTLSFSLSLHQNV